MGWEVTFGGSFELDLALYFRDLLGVPAGELGPLIVPVPDRVDALDAAGAWGWWWTSLVGSDAVEVPGELAEVVAGHHDEGARWVAQAQRAARFSPATGLPLREVLPVSEVVAELGIADFRLRLRVLPLADPVWVTVVPGEVLLSPSQVDLEETRGLLVAAVVGAAA